jgi:hypothetical protein
MTKYSIAKFDNSYHKIRTCDSTSAKNIADILNYVMSDDIFIISEEFCSNLNFYGYQKTFSQDKLKSVLKLLNPKKILLKNNFNIEEYFDIPESLEEIIIAFKSYDYNQEIEEFLDRNENLSKYIKTSDNVEKITAREIYNKELTLSHETVHIWFSYKELSGFVETNKYQLGLFEDYYKNIKEVLFKVGDAEFLMPISTFWKSLKIDKKIKNKKSFEKAISIFGTCIGYTLWFPYLDSAPVYTGKTKISIDTFNEKNEEKELDRSQKESFKNICEVSYILPALKADEDIKDVIYELDDDIKEYFYEFEGLDDNGEDKVFIFKIGDNFYEVDIHCSANWVGDFSVRKNLPGDLSIVSIKEIKEYTIISSGDNYINLKY